MQNLTSLLLTGNEFKTLDPRVLQNLTNLNYIYFSWFHLCRAALHVRVCEPHGDGISSTYHLLDNQILRARKMYTDTIKKRYNYKNLYTDM
ncbi:relaxin receptor 2-like [Rhagoletis pomonella]|uniref:relaxin receptor 2-like n=1 Tax=Rhagoletis pomonella TaxID=28610 RepID=UPI001781DD3F|nr:relaxin receptor 2-like [Rhagoletis pomonella]XP_036343378.1 relaxin receptor 2-like [Rhagoletis pomonella]